MARTRQGTKGVERNLKRRGHRPDRMGDEHVLRYKPDHENTLYVYARCPVGGQMYISTAQKRASDDQIRVSLFPEGGNTEMMVGYVPGKQIELYEKLTTPAGPAYGVLGLTNKIVPRDLFSGYVLDLRSPDSVDLLVEGDGRLIAQGKLTKGELFRQTFKIMVEHSECPIIRKADEIAIRDLQMNVMKTRNDMAMGRERYNLVVI